MNPIPTTTSTCIYDDPATIRALRAIVRLCLDLPGSIHPRCHDDIGLLLHPLAVHLRQRHDAGGCALPVPEWIGAFDAVLAEGEYESFTWLGKHLSHGTRHLLPLYASMLAYLEQSTDEVTLDVAPNVGHVRRIFGLDAVEAQLIELAACLELSSFGFMYLSIERPAAKIWRAIATALDVPAPEVARALQPGGRIAGSGLLQGDCDGTAALRNALDLSPLGKQMFVRPFVSEEAMFAALLAPLPPPADRVQLQWPALEVERRTVLAMLDTALETSERGINILLHGVPGTGKTEFAKQLAAALPCAAYEVPYKDQEGNEASRVARLASLHAAQRMLGTGRTAILVLDEAEDVFQEGLIGEPRAGASRRAGSKAWMNRFLETNAHPVIWITNSTRGMDPAYLRRFALCIGFESPDIGVRRKIVERHLGDLGVTDPMKTSIAQCKDLSPALIAASARAARLARGKAGMPDEVVMCHLNGQARTLRLPALGMARASRTRFDPAYLHLGGRFTAQQVVDAVVRHGSGTVLMSGPPGTGKTQLANAIAEKLGRELLYYTASDINRKWFGESEQQVAHIFSGCAPEREVIFIDEAETLLGAREDAQHKGMEAVTAEFLRQIEGFAGVFLCATNHVTSIDKALMRRFAFRLEFRPLNRLQRERLLREMLALPPSHVLSASCAQRLDRMEGLTPGDYANVQRRFELIGFSATVEDWLAELQQEWCTKPCLPPAKPIGFL